MATAPTRTPTSTRKPRAHEIDMHGLTHLGKVRKSNQDHFLICELKKQMDVHLTSLPDAAALMGAERLAYMVMVADGVGSRSAGEEASRRALHGITQYVIQALRCYYTADSTDETAFAEALQGSALQVHADLAKLAEEDPERRGMATTLTLWIGVWPKAYLVQVGDSRFYLLRKGELTQVSHDQTMAQELIDQGVFTRTDAFNTRWANVLSSSLGGQQSAPVVTQLEQDWGQVGLLCSDGLTKHVSDERIKERLLQMTTAKQTCEDLLQDALDGGGSDNITIIVGRDIKKDPD
ncbi:MAG: serine/threonine-protein phosphatase [Gemmatimonadota bacterium]|nr:serine/threonine-protein phosphatase [Gemmatimonadota bacterium]